MKKMSVVFLLLLLGAFLIAGCSTTGNRALKDETQQSITSKFIEGETTKEEVITLLGNPTETSFTDSGLEIIKYEYTRMTPKARNFIPYNFFSLGTDDKKKELVILLDENDVISKLVMNESEAETRTGIAE